MYMHTQVAQIVMVDTTAEQTVRNGDMNTENTITTMAVAVVAVVAVAAVAAILLVRIVAVVVETRITITKANI